MYSVMRRVAPPLMILSLAACAGDPFGGGDSLRTQDEAAASAGQVDARVGGQTGVQAAGQVAATPTPKTKDSIAVGTGPAKTAEAMDTTSSAERKAAAAASTPAKAELGRTVASLGDPSQTGFWLMTPLVTAKTKGRVEDPSTGKTAEVELRPSGGAKGSGSQISLAAMRLLEVPLTALPELVVYRR